jgi:hypothetical protein
MKILEQRCRLYRKVSFVHVFDSVIELGSFTVHQGEDVNTESTR